MPSDAGADAGSDLPALPEIDDRLVLPGTRFEMLDGRLVYVPPCDGPHGARQVQVCALIEAHTGPAFEVSADMLTRTSRIDDFAPDISIHEKAPHPVTGRPRLAQLVFEVVSTQTLGNAARKARKLIERGVRRVFAIDVGRSRALEWSAALDGWRVLEAGGVISDPALEVALPIAVLIRDTRADDAVMRALAARHNPVLEDIKAASRNEGRAEGRAEGARDGVGRGRAEAIVAVLDARGISMERGERDRILGERDLARLERWTARAVVCTSIAELLAER